MYFTKVALMENDFHLYLDTCTSDIHCIGSFSALNLFSLKERLSALATHLTDKLVWQDTKEMVLTLT